MNKHIQKEEIIKLTKLFTNTCKNVYDKGFFHLLSANYFASFFTFFSQLLVAWWLAPADIGRIKVLQSILNIAVIFATLGLDTSILRLCSMDRAMGERKYLFERTCIYIFPAVIFIYSLLWIAARLHWLSKDLVVNNYAPLYMLALLPLAYFTLFIRFLESVKRFKLIAKNQSMMRVISVLIIISFTFWWRMEGYIIGTVLNLMALAMLFFILSKTTLKEVPTIPIQDSLALHWNYAKYAILINVIAQISLVADILIVNYFVNNRGLVGQYSFATIFIVGFNVLLITFQQVAIPHISGQSKNLSTVIANIKRYTGLLRLTSTAFFIGGFIFVPLFIHYVFRGKYDDSLVFFRILFVAFYFRSLRILQWSALLGMGFFNWVLYISALILCINFGMSLLFVKLFGIQGVAWAQVLTSLISMLIISFVYKKLTFAHREDYA